MPVFWLASILLYYLTYRAQIFPNGGYVEFSDDPFEWVWHLVLPWLRSRSSSSASTPESCAPTCWT